MTPSPNFAYLAHHDPRLVAMATRAEALFATEPAATLVLLRIFGEQLAQRAAAKVNLLEGFQETQHALVDRLFERGYIGATQRGLFHDLRRAANPAAHEWKGDHQIALHQLRMARELGVWFQRTFGNNRKFDPGPFVPPPEPAPAAAGADPALHAELERLEAQVVALRKELLAVQAAAMAAPAAEIAATLHRSKEASESITLDEQATRAIIDAQLRTAGWEADSKATTHQAGVRPQRGKNLAIAEWPTTVDGKAGRADYVLFAGLTAVAVVEAKRTHKDIPGVIPQAKRYATGFAAEGGVALAEGAPWGTLKIPFLFATNGRPYLRQFLQKSGIWFLDARRATNHPVPLEGWYTAEGLLDLLKQDVDRAHAELAVQPMPYIDREYQKRAIHAVEAVLAEPPRNGLERHTALLAMATGTGKTRTCIGLCYRLLKTRRFRRILFVVDRYALAKQTFDAFTDLRLEQLQSFTDIFDVKSIGDLQPEPETRLHIATVQSMVRRVLGPHDDVSVAAIPPVDTYDCIIVDECHRGYLLDRELSEREQVFRDEADYVSRYRRVLDHFDAVKIGLTATPALHTTEIFGKPVFTYAYREAVCDGFLVDHDPPIRIVTKLVQDGIHYQAHEEVTVLDRSRQMVLPEILPDAVDFEVDDFNRRVITEDFTRVVLEEVAKYVDPHDPEKTLVFCVDDQHADATVRLFKAALAKQWGEVDDDMVAKITGASDLPNELIKRYRNELAPSIAVTVDLLTTGIDVPRIANLVFLRRVRSRILYEQMLGRATRLCDEIGKERFRIFDAVDLYRGLEAVSTMKPVVVNPSVTFAQLVTEVLATDDAEHRAEALAELVAKLQRKKRALVGDAGDRFETAAGGTIKEVLAVLRSGDDAAAAGWLREHTRLGEVLDGVAPATAYRPVVSQEPDQLREVTTGYGQHRKPEDYLDSFRLFVEGNMNQLPALRTVVTRPRDLTRAQLKELRLALDQAGYSEAYLQTAFKQAKNEDTAASIVGFVRRMALGSPLVPYGERVDRGVRRFLAAHPLDAPQRKWLERSALALKNEVIVDREALDRGQFAAQGGFTRINKSFDGKVEAVLGDLSDEVWRDVS